MNLTPKKIFSRFGFAQLAGELASIALSLLIFIPLAKPENIQKVVDAAGPGAAMFLLYVPKFGYLLLFWLIIRNIPKVQWDRRRMRFGELLQAFVMMYALSQILNSVGTAITGVTPVGSMEQTELFESMVNSKILMGVLIPVVIGPVLEEIIFRKLMIDRLHGFGETTVIVFSALCFGLYHGNLTQFLYTTVVGLFLGYVYCKTGTILVTMVMHILFNGTSSLLLMLIPLLEQGEEALITGLLVIVPLVIIVVVVGLIFTIKHLKKKDIQLDDTMPTALQKGEVLLTVYLNPGMILLLVFSVAGIVMDLMNIELGASLFE